MSEGQKNQFDGSTDDIWLDLRTKGSYEWKQM